MVERDVNFSDAQNDVVEFGADQQPTAVTPVEIAQATNDPVFVDPATGQDIQQPTPSAQTIGATVIQVAADNRAILPEGASIENIIVEGDNLVLVQPDGTRIIIEGASLNVPTFLIGQVEVPSQVLIAALQANGINVAAGPDGTVSVVSAGSSGGDLSDGEGNIGEAGPVIDLLGDTDFGFDAPTLEALADAGNVDPELEDFLAGGISEEDLSTGLKEPDDGSDSSTITGTFAGTDFENTALTYTFGLPTTELSSGGISLVWTINADGVLEGRAGEDGPVIIRAEISGSTYTITLLGPIDHPDTAQEDSIDLQIPVTVTDVDNGTDTAIMTVRIEDDSPEAGANNNVQLDDDAIQSEQTEGEGSDEPVPLRSQLVSVSFAGNPGGEGDDADSVNASGILAHNYGADGAGSLLLTVEGIVLPAGFTATVSEDGLVLTILQGDVPVLEVALQDSTSGAYVVRQLNPIDHPSTNSGSEDPGNDDLPQFELLAVDKTQTAFEDNLFFDLKYVVTDGDGDTAVGSFSIDVDDDTPVVGESSLIQLDDDALESGNGDFAVGDQQETEGAPQVEGVLAHSYGADGAGSILLTGVAGATFGAPDSEAGEGAFFYSVSDDGLTVIVTQIQSGEPVDVLELTLSDSTSGSYTLTQLNAVRHPDGTTEDNVGFSFQYTVTDGDGDSVNGALEVDVDDDGPVLDVSAPQAVGNGLFLEGFTPNNNAWGTGSGVAAGTTAGAWTVGASPVGGASQIQLEKIGDGYRGADSVGNNTMVDMEASPGNLQISQSVSGLVANETYELTFEIGKASDASEGSAKLEVFWNGVSVGVFDPASGALQTISIVVTAANGSNEVTFREIGAAGDNTGTYLSNISLSDAIIIDETAGIDAGSDELSGAESLFAGVNAGIDADMPEAQYAQGTGSVVTVDVDFGADGAAAGGGLAYAFTLSADGIDSGLKTTDGQSIHLYKNADGLVIGVYDADNNGVSSTDPVAFALHIDGSGVVTVAQYVSLFNPDATSADDAVYLTPGILSATVTATDADNDSVTKSADISGRIRFEDDGPIVTLNVGDETAITLTTQDAETIGELSDTAVSTANFGSVFTSAIAYGADGMASSSTVYALNLTGADGADSGLDSKGLQVNLFEIGGVIYGSTTSSEAQAISTAVFSLTVDGNGVVTLTQFQSIDHPLPGAGSSYDEQLASLANNLVSLTATVSATDKDGDTDVKTASIDLGGNIHFADDGPRLTGTKISTIVNEDDIDTSWSDGSSPHGANQPDSDNDGDNSHTEAASGPNDPAIVTGSLATLVQGADTPFTYGFTANALTYLQGLGLSTNEMVNGQNTALALTYEQSTSGSWVIIKGIEPDAPGNGSTNSSNIVFELRINSTTGAYEFRLFDELYHQAPESGADENTALISGAETIDAIVFGQIIQVTDSDGDSVTLGDSFEIQVIDDIPVAKLETRPGEYVTIDESNGNQADDINSSQLPSEVRNLFRALEQSNATGDDPHSDGVSGLSGKPVIGYAYSDEHIVTNLGSGVGADAPADAYRLTLEVTDGTPSGLSTTEGTAILLYKVGDLVVGRVGGPSGTVAFAIAIDQNGHAAIAQYLSIKHDDAGDFNESNDNGSGATDAAPDNDPNPVQETIASGAIKAVLTITDSDGDTVRSQEVDISHQIRFLDDGPSVDVGSVWNADLSTVVLDETTPGGNPNDNTGTSTWTATTNINAAQAIGVQSTTASGPGNGTSVAELFSVSVAQGADGAVVAKAFSFDLRDASGNLVSNGSSVGVETTLRVSDVLGSAFDNLSAAGQTIWLYKVSDTLIIGRIGANTADTSDDFIALKIELTGSTTDPQFVVSQYLPISHANSNDDDDSASLNLRDNDASLSVKLTVTATDGDGDVATDSQTIKLIDRNETVIRIEDDAPTVDVTANANAATQLVAELDETQGADRYNGAEVEDANGNANTDDAGPGLAQVTTSIAGGLASLFTVSGSYGTDGPGTTTGTLSFVTSSWSNNGYATNLQATDGGNIRLFVSGSTITGRDMQNNTVFKIEIIGSGASAQLQTTLFEAIKHSDGNLFDAETVLKVIGNVTIGLEYDVERTDSDGDDDDDSATITLISANNSVISFDDDGPKLDVSAPQAVSNGLFFDGFTPNNNAWGTGSGVVVGTTAGAWTVGASSVGGATQIQLEKVGDGYRGADSPTNNAMVDLEASPGNLQITQAVTGLASGETYELTFEIGKANDGSAGTAKLEVLWNGVSVGTFDPQSGLMQTISVVVTAAGGNNSVTFREIGTTGDNTGTYLSNISLSDAIIIDETTGLDGGSDEVNNVTSLFASVNAGIDPEMTAQYAQGTGSIVNVNVDFGADGAANGGGLAYALTLSANGVASGLKTTEGKDIYLFKDASGRIVGVYDDNGNGISSLDKAAFAVHINGSGVVTIAQYVSLYNPNPNNADDAVHLNTGILSASVTATDGDGDNITKSADISGRIRFEDDGPIVTLTVGSEATVLLTTQDAQTIGNLSDTSTSAADFGGAFISTVDLGSDGGTSVKTFALSLKVAEGTDSGLDSNGKQVNLFEINGVIYGSTTSVESEAISKAVFSLSVNGSGVVTLTQMETIDHAQPGSNAGFDTQFATLADNLVSLTATVTATDKDGDTDSKTASIDLGGNVRFADDGPSLTGSKISVQVNEDDIETNWSEGTSPHGQGNNDPENDGDNSYTENASGSADGAIVKGSLAGLVTSGADDPATFHFTSNAIAYLQALNLTSNQPVNGQPAALPLTYAQTSTNGWLIITASEADAATPGDTANPVFEIRINTTSGAYEFRLFDELYHKAPANGADENTQLRSGEAVIEAIRFGDIIEAKDSDGDTVNLGSSFEIKIIDDVPEAVLSVDRFEYVIHDETAAIQTAGDADDQLGSELSAEVRQLFASIENTNPRVTGDDPHASGTSSISNAPVIGYAYSADNIVSTAGSDVGADASAAVFKLSLTITEGALSGLKTTEGTDIRLYTLGDVVVGRVGGATGVVAFAIAVDQNGHIALAQYLSIKHDDQGDNNENNDNGYGSGDAYPNDSPNPQQETLLANSVKVTLTITDSDGDTDTATVDVSQQIRFLDDGPTVTVNDVDNVSLSLIRLDETTPGDLPNDNTPNTEWVPTTNLAQAVAIGSMATPTVAAGTSVSELFAVDASTGVDGGTITSAFSFVLKGSYGQTLDSGSTTGVETNLKVANTVGSPWYNANGLSDPGQTIWLYKISDTVLVGKIGHDTNTTSDDYIVLKIELTGSASTTQLVVTQYLPIAHPDGSNPDDARSLTLADNDAGLSINLTVSATDGDGDTASDSETIEIIDHNSTVVTFEDDGPQITVVANSNAAASLATELDETVGADRYNGSETETGSNTNTDDASGALAQVTTSVTGGLASLFNVTTDFGTDGAGSVTGSFSLTTTGGNGPFATNLSATNGGAITLSIESGVLVGRDAANDLVFKIEIVGSGASAQMKTTLYEAINHGADGTQFDATAVLRLATQNTSIGLTYTATIKDADGDSKTSSATLTLIDTSTSQFAFDDDGPIATNDLAQTSIEGGAQIGGNVLTNDQVGSDLGTLTSVTIGNQAYAIAASGTTPVNTAYGTYSFNSDGSWTFQAASNLNNAQAVDASFNYTLTDGDGDTATAVQSISVEDGALPTTSNGANNPLALTVDEEGLGTAGATGTASATDVEYSAGTVGFTAGSDNLVSYAFGSTAGITVDVDGVGSADIVWTANGAYQLIGSINGAPAIMVTLTTPASAIAAGASGTASVNVELTDNFPHANADGENKVTLTGITVVATDTDGDTATASVTVTVVDDVPTTTGSDAQGAELIVNGGFEINPGVTAGNFTTTTGVTGWSSANAVPFELQNGNVGGLTAHSGDIKVELDSDPNTGNSNATIQQTVSGLEAGKTYELTFWYSERPDGNNTSGVKVYFDGNPVYQIDPQSAEPGWQKITISVTATGSSAVLAFEGTGASDTLGAYIDDVSLKAAIIDDEALFGGIAGGQGDAAGAINSVDGKISITAGADGLKTIAVTGVTAKDESGANQTLQALYQGKAYAVTSTWTANGQGGAYVGTIATDAGPKTVYTLTMASNGSYSMVLLLPLVHALVNDPQTAAAETSYEDNLTLSFGYDVTDNDGDVASAAIVIQVDDDSPKIIDSAGLSIVEDASLFSGSVIQLDELGADGGSLTSVTVGDGNGTQTVAIPTDGTAATVVTSFGTYTFKADGSWTFDPSAQANNAAAAATSFSYTLTDGDGDQATGTQQISITDGANPTGLGNTITFLQVDDSGLTSNATTTDSETITFGAGSDAFVSAAFSTDLSQLSNALTWNRVSDTEITGKIGGILIATLTLVTTDLAAQNKVEVKLTLSDNYPLHPTQGDDLAQFGKIDVIAMDTDGDTASAVVSAEVSDDTPSLNFATGLSEINEGATINGSYNFHPGADGVNELEVIFNGVSKFINLADVATNGSVEFTTSSGTLTVNENKTWSFTASAVSTDTPVSIKLKAVDGDNDTQETTYNFTIKNVSAPLVISGAVTGTVEEEHGLAGGRDDTASLAGGDLDTSGNLNLTTNVSTGSYGDLVTGGKDGVISYAFELPADKAVFTSANQPLTSDDKPVYFAIEGGNLIGYVNSDGGNSPYGAGDTKIFTMTLNPSTGAYVFTLNAPIDHPVNSAEDAITIKLDGLVRVTDAGGPISDTSVGLAASITVIDDAPVAGNDTASVIAVPPANYNVAFVLDFSGSIDNPELTQMLNGVKAAAQQLFNSTTGDVKIELIAFGDDATARSVTSYTELVNVLNGWSADRPIDDDDTDFTDAIEEVLAEYSALPGYSNQVFFLSDGNPTKNLGSGNNVLNSTVANEWNTFVDTNNVKVTAIGVGDDISQSSLQQIDVDGNVNVIQLANFSDIVTALVNLVSTPAVTGNVLTGGSAASNDFFGADGGKIAAVSSGNVADPSGVVGNTIVGTYGSLVLQANGTYAYTLDSKSAAVRGLKGNESDVDVFTYKVVDGDGDVATATITITVQGTNEAPAGINATVATDEDTSITLTAAQFGFTDIENDGLSGIFIKALPGAGALTLNGSPVASNTFVSASDLAAGKLVFTPATNASGSGYASIQFAVKDNGGTANGGQDTDQTPNTLTIDVTPVNDAPSAVINNLAYTATEQTTLTLHGTGLSVGDIDAGTNDMTVTLSVGYGKLTITGGNSGVQVSNNNSSSVTLIGTYAEINALLAGGGSGGNSKTIYYLADTDAPPSSTTLTLTVNDGGNSGTGGAKTASDVATINITAVNDDPTATISPTTYNATEQTTLVLHGTGLSVSDPDAGLNDVTVKLSVGTGKLNVAAGDSGVIVTNSGTSIVTLVGTITEINALLTGGGAKTVTYIADSDTPASSTTLTLSVNDGGSTGSGGAESDTDTATINIAAVNDAPTAAITPTSYNATEQVALALQGSGLSIGDVDAASDDVSVTLSVGFGKLTVGSGNSGVSVTNNGTMSVTLVGTLAEINALLAGGGSGLSAKTVTYLADSDTPPGSTVLTMVVNDGANNGTGGALTATDTATINIAAVNDATSYIADHVYTNAASGGNSSIPEWALLFNDDKDNLLDLTQVKNASGFDSIALSGSNILINDNNTEGGTFEYRVGSTDVSVNLYRDSNDMDGSNGNDIIIDVLGGNTDLDGNGGNDILIGNSGIDTMTGGSGADVFVIGADSVSVGIHDIITDYDMAQGDVIDLSEILSGLASNTALESGYVKLVQNGGNAELQVDTDGAGAAKSFETVAVLNSFNVTSEHVRILFNDHKTADDV